MSKKLNDLEHGREQTQEDTDKDMWLCILVVEPLRSGNAPPLIGLTTKKKIFLCFFPKSAESTFFCL